MGVVFEKANWRARALGLCGFRLACMSICNGRSLTLTLCSAGSEGGASGGRAEENAHSSSSLAAVGGGGGTAAAAGVVGFGVEDLDESCEEASAANGSLVGFCDGGGWE